MALTNSTDYSIDRDTLIKASLRLIGVGSIDEAPTASEITNAGEALNIMVKAWQADGLHLWQIRDYSLPPTLATAQYSLGSATIGHRPLRIVSIDYKNTASNIEVPMTELSRAEYNNLPNKAETGTPVQFFYDPQLTNGQLYVWPTPDATFVAGYTMEIEYQKPFDDLDVVSTDDFEFPSEWYEAIKWGLAARLAPEYGVPLNERRLLGQEAAGAKQNVLDWDQEPVSVYFQPARRNG